MKGCSLKEPGCQDARMSLSGSWAFLRQALSLAPPFFNSILSWNHAYGFSGSFFIKSLCSYGKLKTCMYTFLKLDRKRAWLGGCETHVEPILFLNTWSEHSCWAHVWIKPWCYWSFGILFATLLHPTLKTLSEQDCAHLWSFSSQPMLGTLLSWVNPINSETEKQMQAMWQWSVSHDYNRIYKAAVLQRETVHST